MEEDQNYLKVKKIILFFLSFLLSLNCFVNEIKISKIVELEDPWGSTFINKNELIITEKFGEFKLINIENGKFSKIKHNINILVDGQGGLLDVIYQDEYLWVSYSENRGGGKSNTSIAKGKFNRKTLTLRISFKQLQILILVTILVQG